MPAAGSSDVSKGGGCRGCRRGGGEECGRCAMTLYTPQLEMQVRVKSSEAVEFGNANAPDGGAQRTFGV